MYFVPGQRQFFRVRASGGDYSLELHALGVPDPNGEREPNDGVPYGEALPVGVSRTGRLPGGNDLDEYRFSLAATDHLIVHLEAPPDGDVVMDLQDDVGPSIRRRVAAGGVLADDVLLAEGDYRLVLHAERPGEGRYAVRLERTDPFALADDQEPNDAPAQARPLAGGGRVEGFATADGDVDWYRLPALEATAAIAVVVEGEVRGVTLSDGTNDLPLRPDPDGVTFRSDPLPTGALLFLRISATGDYAFRIDGLPVTAPSPAPAAVELVARVGDPEVAAFWPAGQRATGSLEISSTDSAGLDVAIDVATSDRRWSAALGQSDVHVGPGESATVPFVLSVPADAEADVPVRVTLRARGPDGGQRTAWVDVTPRRDALPVEPFRAWIVPDALLGGLDVASPALGASVIPTLDPQAEAELHDGFAPSDGGLDGPVSSLPLALTVDLAGDEPVPVAGTILHPLSGDPSLGDSPRRFELLLSLDGGSWETVLAGELARSASEQSFVLDHPRPARFAQLRVISTQRDAAGRIGLGEWKVVAAPGTPLPGGPLDLAEPARGGHVVWTRPQLSRIEVAESLLSEEVEAPEAVAGKPGERLTWVVGFLEDRAARVTAFEWSDPPGSDKARRFKQVDLAVSLESPLGPWQELGSWPLERGADGTVSPFVPDEPVWARFVRYTTAPVPRGATGPELPSALRIVEAAGDATYRSILGQWGLGERSGPLELASPPEEGIGDDPNDDSPDQPRTLAPGAVASGRVHHDQDTDWYRVTVPEGHRSLALTVEGVPVVGVSLALVDSSGLAVPMASRSGPRPGSVRYEASVSAGPYLLEVRQPAASVAVTFDTSASVGPYLDAILAGVRAFGEDVVAGREAVRILPFDEPSLLEGWSDQPYDIQGAAAGYVVRASSSGAEANIARAARDLAAREGARAILVITDAASSSYLATADLWDLLAETRPLIFALQTGGLHEAPAVQRHHLMADWAASAGGVYGYARSGGDIARAFDHVATWLRRPAGYRLTVETSPEELPPPEPARLSVTAPRTPGGTAGVVLGKDVAIELILDTSGSMLERIRGERRIDIAKRVLTDLVTRDLPPGIPVALRVFADKAKSCDTELAVPLGPLDPAAMAAVIGGRHVPRNGAHAAGRGHRQRARRPGGRGRPPDRRRRERRQGELPRRPGGGGARARRARLRRAAQRGRPGAR